MSAYKKLIVFTTFFTPLFSFASNNDAHHLGLYWGIPFVVVLLSIALGPLLFTKIWHKHFGKIVGLVTLCFLSPFYIFFGFHETLHLVAHAIIEEYIPFILLLVALYTVSGGILIWGNLQGTPKTNTKLLAIGTILASIMGTTGAAMLLIRPLLRANENRRHKVHTVVFFIFLVANIGGGLTPLGDPPLFLGFLKGVDFLWTVKHMLLPVLISSVILLSVYFWLDNRYFRQPDELLPDDGKNKHNKKQPLKIHGKINFIFLAMIVGAVLMSGIWKSDEAITVFGTKVGMVQLLRDTLLIIITALSLFFTRKPVRAGNEFNWEPMLEVGKLFLAIFITITPVLGMLKMGESGHFAPLIQMVKTADGSPINAMYFWMTGSLSGFLDNAPTYLVFFNMAGGQPNVLMSELSTTLLAISMGAVFMGALTYIGNAPNFMVKSIAEQRKVKMPTFFGYMAWSLGILIPLFLLHTLIFFVF
ncbi:MAG: sodium:proton antiporter [Neisseriaceae bacterium]|nr:sodium:proton antiporter [Neisseriaceae bacterium]